MSDEFKRNIPGFRGGSGGRGTAGGPCPCCVETSDKASRSRMARARLKQSDYRLISEGIEAAKWEAMEDADNCNNPDCCECNDSAICPGCYWCEESPAPEDAGPHTADT